MEVFINEKKYDVTEALTVYELLIIADIQDYRGIALALNEKIIPRSSWDKFQLQHQDKILLIRATHGG